MRCHGVGLRELAEMRPQRQVQKVAVGRAASESIARVPTKINRSSQITIEAAPGFHAMGRPRRGGWGAARLWERTARTVVPH
jgi:hypothetical protein